MTVKQMDAGVWTTRTGVLLPMKDMTDLHLAVAIDMTSMLLNGPESSPETYRLRVSKLGQLLDEKRRRDVSLQSRTA